MIVEMQQVSFLRCNASNGFNSSSTMIFGRRRESLTYANWVAYMTIFETVVRVMRVHVDRSECSSPNLVAQIMVLVKESRAVVS